MGQMTNEALELDNVDQLIGYLRAQHSAYLKYQDVTYYLTDANDIYWRAQDVNVKNEKGHYTDCSTLIPMVTEFVNDPFLPEGASIASAFAECTFYASVKA